jgi:hypothetical protein
VLGFAYLASISASINAACTNHTVKDVVKVNVSPTVFTGYDWNFHILQVVWQLGALNPEGKNIGPHPELTNGNTLPI